MTHGDKCLDLYAKVKNGQYAKRNIAEPDAEYEKQKDDCKFRPEINQMGCHLSKPHQTLDQIKGVKEKITLLEKGRAIQDQISATQARNPGKGLSKKKKRTNKEPQMLGPATMQTGSEKSRFKSAFGKLDPPKRLHPKALHQRQMRKPPVSFFNSQRFDRA